jgi:hypothetical protein
MQLCADFAACGATAAMLSRQGPKQFEYPDAAASARKLDG